jgi:hypothetical protein
MQKIRIIGFYLKIGYIGSSKWKKKFLQTAVFRLHIYLRTNKTFVQNSLYVFDNWGNSVSHKKTQYNYRKNYSMYLRLNLSTTPDLKF